MRLLERRDGGGGWDEGGGEVPESEEEEGEGGEEDKGGSCHIAVYVRLLGASSLEMNERCRELEGVATRGDLPHRCRQRPHRRRRRGRYVKEGKVARRRCMTCSEQVGEEAVRASWRIGKVSCSLPLLWSHWRSEKMSPPEVIYEAGRGWRSVGLRNEQEP